MTQVIQIDKDWVEYKEAEDHWTNTNATYQEGAG